MGERTCPMCDRKSGYLAKLRRALIVADDNLERLRRTDSVHDLAARETLRTRAMIKEVLAATESY